VHAIRERRLPLDGKLAALSRLARTLIEQRGRINDHDVASFTEAGFDQALVLDVILVVAASTMTNYTSSVTQPPLEELFQQHAWKA
jgi:alkylhydroperoxidase family enzyme